MLSYPSDSGWKPMACQADSALGKQKAKLYYTPVEEGRKRVLLIAASILAARKLAQYDKPCPAIEATIADSISMAEKIMRKIDAMIPSRQ
jgi:hypothetical protein